jgi:hypothetical protein
MEPQSDLGLARAGPQPFLVCFDVLPASDPDAAYTIIFFFGRNRNNPLLSSHAHTPVARVAYVVIEVPDH